MLNRQSPLPLYHQLAEQLAAEIRDGAYAPGDRVPSENELAAQHGIGRPTARQAVDSLVRKGILVRKRGSGTFVAPQREAVDLFSLAGTTAAFLNAGLDMDIRLASPPHPVLVDRSDESNPFAGRMALQFSRVSLVAQVPVLLEDFTLDPDVFAGLDRLDLEGRSLSRVVAEAYHLTPTSCEQRFRLVFPDDRVAALMGTVKTTPLLLVLRSLRFANLGTAIHCALTCRTDRFDFTQTLGEHNDVQTD